MDGRDKSPETQQYPLTRFEISLIERLREQGQQQLSKPPDDGFASQTLRLSAWKGDHDLGLYHIDTRKILGECLDAGLKIKHRLFNISVAEQAHVEDTSICKAETEEYQPTFEPAPEPAGEEEPISWEDIKQDIIPSCVHQVTFTIDDVTPEVRRHLDLTFPGVIIQNHTTPESNNSPETRVSRGTSTTRRLSSEISSTLSTPPSSQSSLDPHIAASPTTPTTIAESIGLSLQNPETIAGIYSHWELKQSVQIFRKETSDVTIDDQLFNYYLNIVDLYIIAEHIPSPALQYKLLLAFQTTNQAQREHMPHIETAVKAFQYLPATKPLCQWLAIIFAFLWDTSDDGTWSDLRKEYPNMPLEGLAAFLHSVNLVRCSFTTGDDVAVLERWCTVHSHAKGSKEKKACDQYRSRYTDLLEKGKEEERQFELKEAREVIAEEQKRKREMKRKRSSGPADHGSSRKKGKSRSGGELLN
ncbi:unnamed protein product [Periconia digitata]|uniref:Uncharacterized protein n=1 Tax=Periconia digitata TaxID=1303443 RepID=A0A9W4UG02_9PLEO|nr:unnamed protein product [Periconia digitata]